MKIKAPLFVSILCVHPLHARNPGASKSDPSRTNAPPRGDPALVSPEVHPDRTVPFRLRAPTAKEVKVAGEWPGGATSLTKDDRLVENARQPFAALKEKNVPHEFKETAGNHSWPVWRRYLGEFMPLLFAGANEAATR
jgi:hypothetical protein